MYFHIQKKLWKNKRDISGLLLDILKGKAEYDLVQSENLL
jgi:hypothetical protein